MLTPQLPISDHKYNTFRFFQCSILAIMILLVSPILIKSAAQIVPVILIVCGCPIVLLAIVYRSILAREIDLVGDVIHTRSLFGIRKAVIPLSNILSITKLDSLRNLSLTVREYSLCYSENDVEKEFKFFVGIDNDSINKLNVFVKKVQYKESAE